MLKLEGLHLKKRCICFAIMLALSAPAFSRPLITLSGGLAELPFVGDSTVFPMIDSSLYFYNASHTPKWMPLFGLFVGNEWVVCPNYRFQLGASYYQTGNYYATGEVTQGADFFSENQYHYSYSIYSRQLLIESKFLIDLYTLFHPYLEAGVGAVFNEASDYQVNIQPPFTTFSPAFHHKDTYAFSYILGFGLDYSLPQGWRVGMGYRFSSLGRTKLGASSIDFVPVPNSTLRASHLYAQELLVQLTYNI